jgi:hypothetical protein
MGDMSKDINEGEKMNLIGLLAKIDFRDQDRRIIRGTVKTITDKAEEIKGLCKRGRSRDIDRIIYYPGLCGYRYIDADKTCEHFQFTVRQTRNPE